MMEKYELADGIIIETEDEMVAIGKPGRVTISRNGKIIKTLFVETVERPAANGTAPAAVFKKGLF